MRKFAIITIIILGIIILWPQGIKEPKPCPCPCNEDEYKYYFKKKDSIKKIDDVSEYIPQTIRRSEEYIPQTQRSMT
tara:strand:- start:3645 stop:3875 length:231 start_codon:yes stop_codon:yes gene_type:complete